jgi:glycosyltransferase involved in cell wall biosynthesis
MRVLYASQAYTTHDRRFLQAIADGGHEAHFAALVSDAPAYDARPPPEGVRVHTWLGSAVRTGEDARKAVAGFRELVRAARPDVIHAGPLPSVGLLAVLAAEAPVLAMSWGSDVLAEGVGSASVARDITLVLERAAGLVADCAAVRSACAAWCPGCEARFSIFPWGIDLDGYRPTAGGTPRRRLLSTRTWAPIYGIETLVRAFALAAPSAPDADLVLAADGPLASAIRGLVRELGIEGRVEFPGRLRQDALPALFASVDGYVAASLSDGTSISLLEAMASALPVIVSDVPANREWVEEGQGGWVVRAGDVSGYAEAMRKLLAITPSTRAAMGSQNRRVALERADWRKNREVLWRALRSAAAGERGIGP